MKTIDSFLYRNLSCYRNLSSSRNLTYYRKLSSYRQTPVLLQTDNCPATDRQLSCYRNLSSYKKKLSKSVYNKNCPEKNIDKLVIPVKLYKSLNLEKPIEIIETCKGI